MSKKILLIIDNWDWSAAELALPPHISISVFDFSSDFRKTESEKHKFGFQNPTWVDTAQLMLTRLREFKVGIHKFTAQMRQALSTELNLSENFNGWFLGIAHEKNPHKSSFFYELLMMQIIRKQILSQQFDLVLFSIQTNEILKSIKHNSTAIGLESREIKTPGRKPQSFKKKLRTVLERLPLGDAFLALSPWLIFLYRTLIVRSSGLAKVAPDKKAAFVTYFPYLNDKASTVGKLNNNFTPDIESVLPNFSERVFWLAIYVPFHGLSYRQTVKVALALEKKEIQVSFPEQGLRLVDFLQAWRHWRKLRNLAQGWAQTNRHWFDPRNEWYISDDLWRKSLMQSISMQGILHYLAFRRLFQKAVSLKSITYLCEMQAWEKAMLMAAKDEQCSLTSLGFQHATVSSNYFNYFYDSQEETPVPDILLTNSPWLQSRFMSFVPEVRLVEALRQNYLLDIPKTKSTNDRHHVLSVFSSTSPESTRQLLSLLKIAFSDRTLPFQIKLKLHPSLNINLSGQTFPGLELSHSSAPELLAESFACIIPDSTVALESVAFGVPCITPIFANELPLSPLFDFPHLNHEITRPDQLQTLVFELFSQKDVGKKTSTTDEIKSMWSLDKNLSAWRCIAKDYL